MTGLLILIGLVILALAIYTGLCEVAEAVREDTLAWKGDNDVGDERSN